MMTQTWWLSFCDADRPVGDQFLGVAIVDVTEDDLGDGLRAANAIRAAHGLPPAESDVGWMTAAVQQARAMGCNPGGDVAAVRIDQVPTFAELDAQTPRNRLLSQADILALGIG